MQILPAKHITLAFGVPAISWLSMSNILIRLHICSSHFNLSVACQLISVKLNTIRLFVCFASNYFFNLSSRACALNAVFMLMHLSGQTNTLHSINRFCMSFAKAESSVICQPKQAYLVFTMAFFMFYWAKNDSAEASMRCVLLLLLLLLPFFLLFCCFSCILIYFRLVITHALSHNKL